MIRKVYSNKAKPGWFYRAGGWPDDPKRRAYRSWGFDIHVRDQAGHEQRKRQSGFLSEVEAGKAADNFANAVLRSRYGIREVLPMPSLAQLVTKHLPQISSRRERVRATRVLNAMVGVCGKTLPVDQFKSAHLLDFVTLLRGQGLSPSTIDRDLNIVSTMLHSAVATYFPALAQWLVPKFPRPKYSKRRRERVIKLEEITKLLTNLYREPEPGESDIAVRNRRNVAHVFRMALLTASRPGEIKRLRWDQIDWQAGTFQLIGTKTENSQAHTARYPKITDTIAAIFRERWEAQGKGEIPSWMISASKLLAIESTRSARNSLKLLAPTRTLAQIEMLQSKPLNKHRSLGNSIASSFVNMSSSPLHQSSVYVFTSNGGEVTHYYEIIAGAARACSLLYGRKTLGGFVTHDNRHTAVSYLVEVCGYDLKTVGELTGHSDEVMVLLYSHTQRKTINAAYDDLEKFAGTGTLGS